jgi:hypothetical protein
VQDPNPKRIANLIFIGIKSAAQTFIIIEIGLNISSRMPDEEPVQ